MSATSCFFVGFDGLALFGGRSFFFVSASNITASKMELALLGVWSFRTISAAARFRGTTHAPISHVVMGHDTSDVPTI